MNDSKTLKKIDSKDLAAVTGGGLAQPPIYNGDDGGNNGGGGPGPIAKADPGNGG